MTPLAKASSPIRNTTVYITIIYHILYVDVNECIEDVDGCAQICTDTLGSYTCSCRSGYQLASDDHQCNGMCGLWWH